jgi:hypothetical protein
VRLWPGDDLRPALEAAVAARGCTAAFVLVALDPPHLPIHAWVPINRTIRIHHERLVRFRHLAS